MFLCFYYIIRDSFLLLLSLSRSQLYSTNRIVICFDNKAVDFSVTNHSLEALKFHGKPRDFALGIFFAADFILNMFHGNTFTHALTISDISHCKWTKLLVVSNKLMFFFLLRFLPFSFFYEIMYKHSFSSIFQTISARKDKFSIAKCFVLNVFVYKV